MYEKYSRQALPSKAYRELLGSALCVFNSNNSFIIENILNTADEKIYSWHTLIDETSGRLLPVVEATISSKSDNKISELFSSLILKRNRIIHSFQITGSNNEQILATKEKGGNQFIISERYLLTFITDNEQLSDLLHEFRGY